MAWKRWKSYANISQQEAYQKFTGILEKRETKYKIMRKPPNVMYDAKNEQIQITTGQFTILLIYVSADPLTRIFSKLLNTERHFNGITFLSINFSKDVSEELSLILRSFVKECSNVPWKITKYPRFRFAVLLQLITKFKWKRFLIDNG